MTELLLCGARTLSRHGFPYHKSRNTRLQMSRESDCQESQRDFPVWAHPSPHNACRVRRPWVRELRQPLTLIGAFVGNVRLAVSTCHGCTTLGRAGDAAGWACAKAIPTESWHLAESDPGISRCPPGRAVGLVPPEGPNGRPWLSKFSVDVVGDLSHETGATALGLEKRPCPVPCPPCPPLPRLASPDPATARSGETGRSGARPGPRGESANGHALEIGRAHV